MDKVNVALARLPFGHSEHDDCVDWLMRTAVQMKLDDRIGDVVTLKIADTPTDMVRNALVAEARQEKCDLLLMVDSDMAPDLALPGAQPFWPSSFSFWLQHHRAADPCVIAAPYCCAPPGCDVAVFQWDATPSPADLPDHRLKLTNISRLDAAQRTGFEKVAAIGTGLIMIDLRLFDRLEEPYFYYAYADRARTKKIGTEDITFTRDVSTIARCPVYVNWWAWAGHHKLVKIGKPHQLPSDFVWEKMQEAVLQGGKSDERIVYMDPSVDQRLDEMLEAEPPPAA